MKQYTLLFPAEILWLSCSGKICLVCSRNKVCSLYSRTFEMTAMRATIEATEPCAERLDQWPY